MAEFVRVSVGKGLNLDHVAAWEFTPAEGEKLPRLVVKYALSPKDLVYDGDEATRLQQYLQRLGTGV